MADVDASVPTVSLARDPVAALAGVEVTPRGVKTRPAWRPPLGVGQDDQIPDWSSATPAREEIRSYIRQAAQSKGIDPDIAERVVISEGGFSPASPGDQGSSFGPFQLHYGNVAAGGNRVSGLGDTFTAQTGLNARNPQTWKQQVDFSLDQAARGGWGPWHGAAGAGISQWQGIKGAGSFIGGGGTTANLGGGKTAPVPKPEPRPTLSSRPQPRALQVAPALHHFTYVDDGEEVLKIIRSDGGQEFHKTGRKSDHPSGTVTDLGSLKVGQKLPSEVTAAMPQWEQAMYPSSSEQPTADVPVREGVGSGQEEPPDHSQDYGQIPYGEVQPTLDQLYEQANARAQHQQQIEDVRDTRALQAQPRPSEPAPEAPQLTAQDVSATAARLGTPAPRMLPPPLPQTPESAAATAPTPPPSETISAPNLWGQPTQFPNLPESLKSGMNAGQISEAGAKFLLPTQAQEVPGVTGAVTAALDPTTYLGMGGPAKALARGAVAGAKALPAAATAAREAAPGIVRGVESAAQAAPGALARGLQAAPGAVSGAARALPPHIAQAGEALKAAAPKIAPTAAHALEVSKGLWKPVSLTDRQLAQATPILALRTAGGAAAGAGWETLHTDPQDPNFWPKVAGSAAVGGAGFLALGELVLPRVAEGMTGFLAPIKNLPDQAQPIFVRYANARNANAMKAYNYALEGFDVLGKPGKGTNGLALATSYESEVDLAKIAASHGLSPKQVDFLRRTELLTDALKVPAQIGGDVKARFGVARYFPRADEERLAQAQKAARKGGYSPIDDFHHEREFPTLSDVQLAGGKPMDSFVEPMAWHILHASDSAAKFQFVDDLKALKSSGLDLVRNAGQGDRGWVAGRTFSVKWQAVDFHPDVAKILNNWQKPSAWRTNGFLNGVMRTWSTVKAGMLQGSGFHFNTELKQIMSALPLESRPLAVEKVMQDTLAHFLVPGAQHAFELQNPDLLVEAAQDGLMYRPNDLLRSALPTFMELQGDPQFHGVKGAAVRAGGAGLAMGGATYAQQKATGAEDGEALKSALMWGVGAAAWSATGGELLHRMLWNRGVPTAKLLTYGMLRDKYGGQAAAEFSNEVFGGQNLMAIGRSRTVQDSLRMSAFAWDWLEGWGRQFGNAFKGGPLGNLNRQYWGRAAVLSAFFLEGLNRAFNGHGTDLNADGQQAKLKLTGLYDQHGWPHVDDKGRTYDPYVDILGPYRSFVELAWWLGREASGPDPAASYSQRVTGKADRLPESSTDLPKFVDARLGPIPSLALAGIKNKDWAGREIAAPNDPAWAAAGKFLLNSMGNYAPVGVADVEKLTASREGIGTALLSGVTGTRVSHVTPLTAAYRQLDRIYRDVGLSQDQVNEDRRQYGNLIAVYDAEQARALTNPKLTAAQKLAAVDKLRIPARPKWDEAQLLDKIPDQIQRREVLQALMHTLPGVQGSTAPADVGPDLDLSAISDRYFAAAKSATDPSAANAARQRELAKMAVETNSDPLALRDAIYWRARHPQAPDTPFPSTNVPSEEVDQWVQAWRDPGADPNADPSTAAEQRWTAINGISQSAGIPPEDVWARIKTRMTPTDAELSLQDASRESAFDILMASHNPQKAPRYANLDGTPYQGSGPEQWGAWDKQIAEADKTNRGIAIDPAIRQLKVAQDAGKATRRNILYPETEKPEGQWDYERWFGIGRNMTDPEWREYTTNPQGHYKPIKGMNPEWAKYYDATMQWWREATPTQRLQQKAYVLINGQPKQTTVTGFYKDVRPLINKKWDQHLTADLPSPDPTEPTDQGGTP